MILCVITNSPYFNLRYNIILQPFLRVVNERTRRLKYDVHMGSTFKENLKELLEYEGMTLKELAYKTGISKRSLENYLNTRASMPPADYACKIASALNTTVEFLVLGADSFMEKGFSSEDARIIMLLKRLSDTDKTAFLQLMESITRQNN